MDITEAISNDKICKLLYKILFLTYIKMSNRKEIENLEAVIERHEKVIEKLEVERINRIKELKEIEITKKE